MYNYGAVQDIDARGTIFVPRVGWTIRVTHVSPPMFDMDNDWNYHLARPCENLLYVVVKIVSYKTLSTHFVNRILFLLDCVMSSVSYL